MSSSSAHRHAKALSSMACFCNALSLQTLLLGLLSGLLAWACCHAAAGSAQPIKVVGFAVCDACQDSRLSNFSLPIPGATITLTCKTSTQYTRNATTDMYGVFSFDLPFSEPRLLRMCNVELTSSPFEECITKTKYSWKAISPILSFKPKDQSYIAYSVGWLSYQPSFIPSFCSSSKEVLAKHSHTVDHSSKNITLSPQDFSFPSFLPPLPGFSPPPFPFNYFPPYFPFPGTPFFEPPPLIPGFPPFPFPFPFPFFFPFPFILPFPYPYPFTPPSLPNPFNTLPPFPTLPLPPNPLPPVPVLQVPTLPPNPFPPIPMLPLPPLPPNPLSPSSPSNNLPSPLPPFNFPPLNFPMVPPAHDASWLPPLPFPPSNPSPPQATAKVLEKHP